METHSLILLGLYFCRTVFKQRPQFLFPAGACRLVSVPLPSPLFGTQIPPF